MKLVHKDDGAKSIGFSKEKKKSEYGCGCLFRKWEVGFNPEG